MALSKIEAASVDLTNTFAFQDATFPGLVLEDHQKITDWSTNTGNTTIATLDYANYSHHLIYIQLRLKSGTGDGTHVYMPLFSGAQQLTCGGIIEGRNSSATSSQNTPWISGADIWPRIAFSANEGTTVTTKVFLTSSPNSEYGKKAIVETNWYYRNVGYAKATGTIAVQDGGNVTHVGLNLDHQGGGDHSHMYDVYAFGMKA